MLFFKEFLANSPRDFKQFHLKGNIITVTTYIKQLGLNLKIRTQIKRNKIS